MSNFKPFYDKRNRDNIAKLGPATKAAALKLYDYCIKNKINILIYETIRTVEQQKKNVREGKSKTMKSYHLVGQALDWVLVDAKGNALWNGYNTPPAQQVIKYAKSIGFVSGHDWGWDSPHLQFEHHGYGTDTFCKIKKEAVKEEGLTMEQYNELKKLIAAQSTKIDKLEHELAGKAEIESTNNVGTSHKEALEWAISEGIIKGDGKGSYNPKGALTREQMATMLYRYHNKYIAK